MRIRVLLFGPLAESAGFSSAPVDLPEGATVNDALNCLEGVPADTAFALAVNAVYADGDHLLREGDELALIPPVSGG